MHTTQAIGSLGLPSLSRTKNAVRTAVFSPSAKRVLSRPLTVTTMAGSFYELNAKDIEGKTVSFDKFKGKVVLITNVASR